jgi:uncharacterized protein (DUF1778 family)
MALKGRGYGGKRSKMRDRDRIVIYLEEDEKAEVEEAAQDARISVSGFAAAATLREARRANLDRELSATPRRRH